MASSVQPTLSPTSSILSAFIRRNKNQHSHSHWWSSVCALNNHLRRLVNLTKSPSATFEKRVVHRATFICAKLLPRCYLQVSQLAADNQHAALGLLLLGLLAHVNTTLSPLLPPSPAEIESAAARPITAVTHAEDKKAAQRRPEPEADRGTTVERTSLPSKTDTKPSRPALAVSQEKTPDKKKKKKRSIPEAAPTTEEAPTGEKKVKKKNKKKGDAFSDMFGAFS